MENNQRTSQKKRSSKKWLWISAGLIATGVLSYFGIEYFTKHKKVVKEPNHNEPKKTNPTKPFTIPKTKTANPKTAKGTNKQSAHSNEKKTNIFSLKKGSVGEKVKAVQEALIRKYGKSILPKGGADGKFGPELQNALKKAKLPDTISETLFNVLVQPKEFDALHAARLLNTVANTKNYKQALAILKTIDSSKTYSAVNKNFLSLFTNGVRQTIVNAMLSTFKNEEQKQAIKLEFIRMGLSYDGKKWALSGIGNEEFIITTKATKVWKNPSTSVDVPENMVLGTPIETRGAYTLFENNKQKFLVETKTVIPFQK